MKVELRESAGLWEVALDGSVIFRGPKVICLAVASANQAVIEERENGGDLDSFAANASLNQGGILPAPDWSRINE